MSHLGEPKDEYDVEKDEKSVSVDASGSSYDFQYKYTHPIFRKLLSWGIETQGAHATRRGRYRARR